MGEVFMDRTETSAEAILRDELVRGNRALRGVAPVISHMLESSGHSLVSDAIVARLRGMLSDMAEQLLTVGLTPNKRENADRDQIDQLADELASSNAVLNHLYALAMEGQLTERLHQRSSVDPVLSPLMQELIASDQPAVAELAMNVLAAQSRFAQNQRRMAQPLGELPAGLFATVLKKFKKSDVPIDSEIKSNSISALKAGYDEGSGRLGLMARLVSAMQGGAVAALELDHAGLGLFVSGIATLTRQPRELAILACHERQAARLALSLRAAGLDATSIERQFLLLEPAEMLPEGLTAISPARALELLATSDAVDAYAVGKA